MHIQCPSRLIAFPLQRRGVCCRKPHHWSRASLAGGFKFHALSSKKILFLMSVTRILFVAWYPLGFRANQIPFLNLCVHKVFSYSFRTRKLPDEVFLFTVKHKIFWGRKQSWVPQKLNFSASALYARRDPEFRCKKEACFSPWSRIRLGLECRMYTCCAEKCSGTFITNTCINTLIGENATNAFSAIPSPLPAGANRQKEWEQKNKQWMDLSVLAALAEIRVSSFGRLCTLLACARRSAGETPWWKGNQGSPISRA